MQNGKVCLKCGKPKADSAFFRSSSSYHKDGLVPICRKCIIDAAYDPETGDLDINNFEEVLRQVDKPFLPKIMNAVEKQIGKQYSGKTGYERVKTAVGLYFKNINSLKQYQDTTYSNPDSRYGINAVTDGSSWYVDRIGGALLYDKYKKYTYHAGGIVGDDPTLKQDEVFAKLKRGEAVLTEEQQEPIYEILDFADTMLGKYGALFGAVQSKDLIGSKLQEQIKQDAQQAQSIVEQRDISIENNVTIPVQVLQKLDQSEIKKLTKDISKHTVSEINDVFRKNGMDSVLNPLRPH